MNAIMEIPRPASGPNVPQLVTYDARDLIKEGVQACILLDDQTYYLRITRAGKLILTK
ncbi:MAG: hemin uptake protein HemP [Pseudomonadota bacterium]